jgi:hypothetical protein
MFRSIDSQAGGMGLSKQKFEGLWCGGIPQRLFLGGNVSRALLQFYVLASVCDVWQGIKTGQPAIESTNKLGIRYTQMAPLQPPKSYVWGRPWVQTERTGEKPLRLGNVGLKTLKSCILWSTDNVLRYTDTDTDNVSLTCLLSCHMCMSPHAGSRECHSTLGIPKQQVHSR